jgi:hypothetical protein
MQLATDRSAEEVFKILGYQPFFLREYELLKKRYTFNIPEFGLMSHYEVGLIYVFFSLSLHPWMSVYCVTMKRIRKSECSDESVGAYTKIGIVAHHTLSGCAAK